MRIMAMNKGSDCIAIWNLFYDGVQIVHEGVRSRKQLLRLSILSNILVFAKMLIFVFFVVEKVATLRSLNLIDIWQLL